MAKKAFVPWWVWSAAVVLLAIAVLAAPRSMRTIDPIERAYWEWAEENANDPGTIELVSIEGPQRTDDGPLYRIKTRSPVFGQKLLREDYFVIKSGAARQIRDREGEKHFD